MLNKLITNLKNSLSKKKDEEATEGEDASNEVETSEEAESTTSGDDAAKKKKSMIIKVVVVLGLVYLAVDQFVLKNDEAEVAQVAPAKPKRRKPKTNVATDATAQPNPQAQTAGTPVDPNMVNPTTDPNPKNDTTTLPPTENANVIPKTEDTTAAATNPVETPKNEILSSTVVTPKSETTASEAIDKIVEKPKEEVVDVKPAEKIEVAKPIEEKKEEIKVAEEKPLSLGETKQKEKQLDKELDKLIDGAEGIKKEEKPAVDLKDKIAVEESYIEAPNYENLGRGLVYNCKEKFWVCVDKPTYVQCNKNMKYNKSHSKPAECAVVNVYGTTEDCGQIQKYNVSHNVATDFCN